MPRHIATTKLFLAFSALLLAILLTPFAFAQTKAPAKAAEKPAAQAPAQRQLLRLQFLPIKPEMNTEWQEFRKSESLPALRKAGYKAQEVWVSAIFGELGYVIVTPVESLAEFDNPGPFRRVLGEEGARAYNQKAARFIESARYEALETRPDLSIEPKSGWAPKLAVVTTTTIAPGRDEDYENFVKTAVLPAIKKANPQAYLVSRVVYGGNLNQYVSVTLLDSFADLQKWHEAIAKEAAAAKLPAKSAGIVTARENAIYRYVPELSITPTAQKAENK